MKRIAYIRGQNPSQASLARARDSFWSQDTSPKDTKARRSEPLSSRVRMNNRAASVFRFGKSRASVRGVSLIMVFVLFSISNVYPANSHEFNFIWDVLDSLHSVQLAINYRIKAKMPIEKMVSDTKAASEKFKIALRCMQKYDEDKNRDIYRISNSMIYGLDILMGSSELLLNKIHNVAVLLPDGFDDVEHETATFMTRSKNGWKFVSSSLDKLSGLIIEAASNENSAAADSFKISKEERKLLIKRFNELFSDSLKRLPQLQESFDEDEEFKLGDQIDFLLTVRKIRDALTE